MINFSKRMTLNAKFLLRNQGFQYDLFTLKDNFKGAK